MKAVVLSGYGGPEKLDVVDLPMPAIKPEEVLVAVRSISINPADALVRENEALDWIFDGDSIKILGWDLSGVAVNVGSAVSAFKIGDEVFGCVHHPGHGRAYAEYVAAPAAHLALKPANVTHDEAAAATLAALTALQPLQKAGIKAGDRVFISAAGGGVGHFAVQLAKHFGAYVIALASKSKKELLDSLNVDLFIDYQSQNFLDLVKDVDIVLEAVRGDNYILRTLEIIRPGGTLISLWSQITDREEAKARQHGIRAFYNAIQSNGADMMFIARLLASGALRPHISSVFSLNEVRNAHLAIQSNHTQGKIIIRVY